MNDYSQCNTRHPADHPDIRYFRGFFAIGTFTTLTDLIILYILTEWVGIWYLVSACISYSAGSLISYLLNKHLNFKNMSPDYCNQGMVFLGISTCSLFLNLLIVFAGVTFIGLPYLMAKISATGIGFIFNYCGQTRITFRLWQ